LSFEVDGVLLQTADGLSAIKGVFEMLKGDKVYPCISMGPLDELPPLKESEAPETIDRATAGGGGKNEKSDTDNERERKRLEAREIAELAQKCRRSYQDVAKLSAQQRSKLSLLIDSVLKRRVPHILLDLGIESAPALQPSVGGSNVASLSVAEQETGAESAAQKDSATKKDSPVDNAAEVVPLDRVVWMFEESDGWKIHTREVCNLMEETLRAGKTELRTTIGDRRYTVRLAKGSDGKGPNQSDDEGASVYRLRRHIIGPGLQGEWEMLSLKFSPPITMIGQSALGVLEKLWSQGESMKGDSLGLGFLFLYSLMIGQMRVVCISSGGYRYHDYGKNDSHRFALLAAQLYSDSSKHSLLSSSINVLGRNRHLCVRMPKLVDTRATKNSPIFNGWIDEAESKSPLADLFSRLVPYMQKLRRERNQIRFPPPPDKIEKLLEIPAAPTTCKPVILKRPSAILSNTACSNITASAISENEIARLADKLRVNLGVKEGTGQPPADIIDLEDFENLMKLASGTAFGGKPQLVVLKFGSPSCPYCEQIDPFFYSLSMKYGSILIFANICVDDNKAICRKYKIKPIPTTIIVRGDLPDTILGKIEGGGAAFPEELFKLVQKNLNDTEMDQIKLLLLSTYSDKDQKAGCRAISISDNELEALATTPLAQLSHYFIKASRAERGLVNVKTDTAALNLITSHESAETAVAKSMLKRMKADVKAYATTENEKKSAKIVGLRDHDLDVFFNQGGSDGPIREVRDNVDLLLKDLIELRRKDSKAVDTCIPLLSCCSNFVDPEEYQIGSKDRRERVTFTLRRFARQIPFIWNEFLFGSTLSTRRDDDLRDLNPFIENSVLEITQRLLVVTMLRANRVGHTNRCIGSAISLLELLDKALASPVATRVKDGETLLPRLAQASGDLGDGLDSKRHFVNPPEESSGGKGYLQFDPRFLIFEFVWNLLLRKMQVTTVTNFIKSLGKGESTVKQMIMGGR
jgi:thiol-disulfide isomerase/thioredoxin